MLKERSTKFDAGEKPKLLFFEKKKKIQNLKQQLILEEIPKEILLENNILYFFHNMIFSI